MYKEYSKCIHIYNNSNFGILTDGNFFNVIKKEDVDDSFFFLFFIFYFFVNSIEYVSRLFLNHLKYFINKFIFLFQ